MNFVHNVARFQTIEYIQIQCNPYLKFKRTLEIMIILNKNLLKINVALGAGHPPYYLRKF